MSSESNPSDATGRSDAGKSTPDDARSARAVETERRPTHSQSTRDVRVATLEAEIDLLQQERDALEAEVTGLETEIADLEREVARLGRAVADRERQLQRAIDRYERVTGEEYPAADEPTSIPTPARPEDPGADVEAAATDGGRTSASTPRRIAAHVLGWLRRRRRRGRDD